MRDNLNNLARALRVAGYCARADQLIAITGNWLDEGAAELRRLAAYAARKPYSEERRRRGDR